MNRNQWLLVLGSIALISLLYFFGNTKKPKEEGGSNISEVKNEKIFDFNNLLDAAKKGMAESQLENLKKSETQLTEVKDKKQQVEILNQLIEKWETYQKPEISAHYIFQFAETEPTETNWTAAAGKFLFASNQTEDTLLRYYLLGKTVVAYKKALELNPNNLENKINLAACYAFGQTENTMQGVLLLLEVVKQDSMNVKANFLLGKLAMTSGQFEKAIKRFEKVVSLDSINVDAYLNLAEANQSLGNNSRAIKLFEKCKTLVDNPDFQREIDNYINKLKTSN